MFWPKVNAHRRGANKRDEAAIIQTPKVKASSLDRGWHNRDETAHTIHVPKFRREIDKEDPMPRKPSENQPAQNRTGLQCRWRRPNQSCPAPCPALARECFVQKRRWPKAKIMAAPTPCTTRDRDQSVDRGRETTKKRTDGKDHKTGDIDRSLAANIRQPANTRSSSVDIVKISQYDPLNRGEVCAPDLPRGWAALR